MAPPPGTIQRGLLNGPGAAEGAVVVTVSVVLPLVAMELGFSEQPARVIVAGTAQVKLIVPVNP
jgi:hypothetical protein